MTKQEIIQLLLLIKSEYPREHQGTTEETTQAQVTLWAIMLKEYDSKTVFYAFQKHIAGEEGKYKPTIHHFLKNINMLQNGQIKTAGEAWEEVIKNIRSFGIYNQLDGLNALTEFTRKVVNQIGYSEICMSENIEITRAQFRKAYEATEKREIEFNNMPMHLKELQFEADNKRLGMASINEVIKCLS